MDQLKQALVKAGLAPKETLEDKKKAPKKSKVPKKEFKKYGNHQIRTDCEHCGNYSPDVEYYKHNNRLIVKRWLCVKCADEYQISDDLRDTNQSSNARSGQFRRMWGRTKRFK